MYTSATERPHGPGAHGPRRLPPGGSWRQHRCTLLKTAGVWLAVAAFAFALDKVYALFAHGMASPHMTWLFLYPLLGGCVIFALLALLAPRAVARRFWPAARALYGCGLGTLMAGSLLQGIFEIAGTASPYTTVFFVVGALLAVGGVVAACLPRKRAAPLPPGARQG